MRFVYFLLAVVFAVTLYFYCKEEEEDDIWIETTTIQDNHPYEYHSQQAVDTRTSVVDDVVVEHEQDPVESIEMEKPHHLIVVARDILNEYSGRYLVVRNLDKNYYLTQIEEIYIICMQISRSKFVMIFAHSDLDAILDCCDRIGIELNEYDTKRQFIQATQIVDDFDIVEEFSELHDQSKEGGELESTKELTTEKEVPSEKQTKFENKIIAEPKEISTISNRSFFLNKFKEQSIYNPTSIEDLRKNFYKM